MPHCDISCGEVMLHNKLNEVSTGEVSAGEVSSGEVSTGKISTGEVSTGKVSSGEVLTSLKFRIEIRQLSDRIMHHGMIRTLD